MALRMVIENAEPLGMGVWLFQLNPSDVQRLGTPRNSVGSRSVLLVEDPAYDKGAKEFRFDANSVRVLNVGTTPETLVVSSSTIRDPSVKASDLTPFLVRAGSRVRG